MSRARLIFLGFAVLGVGLAFAGLSHLSGRVDALSAAQSTERLLWGQLLFETSGKLAQAHRTVALEKAAADASLLQAAAGLADAAPTLALADPVKKAVAPALEKLPAELRRAGFYLVGTEKGVAMMPADGTPGQAREDRAAFGLAAASLAGAQGTHLLYEGKIYRVAAAPLRVVEGGAQKTVGWLGAAFPLDDAFAAEQARDLTMSVTLVAKDVAASSLPKEQRAAIGSAKDGPFDSPAAAKLGPITLPLFVDKPALSQVKSFPLEGAEGARGVLVAESASLGMLAGFQSRALLVLLALAILVIPVLVMIPSGAAAPVVGRLEAGGREPSLTDLQREEEAADRAAAMGVPASPPPPPAPSAPPPLNIAAPPPPAPVTPDDFPFGGPSDRAQTEQVALPPAPPPTPPAPPPSPSPFSSASPFGPGQTNPFGRAEPQPEAMVEKPFDPFAAASAQSYDSPPPAREPTLNTPVSQELLRRSAPPPAPEANDSTVVAAVPDELLRASAKRTMPGVPIPTAGGATPEESHYQDVFQQFLATRTQCNEPSDGLTFDKFAAKLRKNREQLIQKYNCKSVRFQVYVKDGKAALKATPVRD
jgi:hypothetical protein